VTEVRKATVAELQAEGILLVEDGNHGENRPRPSEFASEGTAFIRAADLDSGRVDFSSASRITDHARKRITKGIGAPGDVLVSHKGTVGKIALVPNDAPPFVCSPQTTFWRTLREDVLDRGYLFAFLRSPIFMAELATRAGETDMAPYVSLTSQRALHVVIPDIRTQRRIASVVGSLDEKLNVDSRITQTILALGTARFRSRFDLGLSGPTSPDWPARLREGWVAATVGDLAKVVGGGTPRTDQPGFWSGGLNHWVTPKDLSRQRSPVLLDTERRITDAGLAQVGSGLLPIGTVLLSSRAPIGYLAITLVPVAVNQGFIAMTPKEGVSDLFLYFWAEASHELILSRANGSTFLEISKASFRPIPVAVPPPDQMAAFDAEVRPLFDRIVVAARETTLLTAIRDSLLPRLFAEDRGGIPL
jgi:type I restriction enzyme S subunit